MLVIVKALHRMLSEGNLVKVLSKVKAVTEVTAPLTLRLNGGLDGT